MLPDRSTLQRLSRFALVVSHRGRLLHATLLPDQAGAARARAAAARLQRALDQLGLDTLRVTLAPVTGVVT